MLLKTVKFWLDEYDYLNDRKFLSKYKIFIQKHYSRHVYKRKSCRYCIPIVTQSIDIQSLIIHKKYTLKKHCKQ